MRAHLRDVYAVGATRHRLQVEVHRGLVLRADQFAVLGDEHVSEVRVEAGLGGDRHVRTALLEVGEQSVQLVLAELVGAAGVLAVTVEPAGRVHRVRAAEVVAVGRLRERLGPLQGQIRRRLVDRRERETREVGPDVGHRVGRHVLGDVAEVLGAAVGDAPVAGVAGVQRHLQVVVRRRQPRVVERHQPVAVGVDDGVARPLGHVAGVQRLHLPETGAVGGRRSRDRPGFVGDAEVVGVVVDDPAGVLVDQPEEDRLLVVRDGIEVAEIEGRVLGVPQVTRLDDGPDRGVLDGVRRRVVDDAALDRALAGLDEGLLRTLARPAEKVTPTSSAFSSEVTVNVACPFSSVVPVADVPLAGSPSTLEKTNPSGAKNETDAETSVSGSRLPFWSRTVTVKLFVSPTTALSSGGETSMNVGAGWDCITTFAGTVLPHGTRTSLRPALEKPARETSTSYLPGGTSTVYSPSRSVTAVATQSPSSRPSRRRSLRRRRRCPGPRRDRRRTRRCRP